MKDYNEMARAVFERRDEYEKKKKQKIRTAVFAVSVLVLAAGLIFAGVRLNGKKNSGGSNNDVLTQTDNGNNNSNSSQENNGNETVGQVKYASLKAENTFTAYLDSWDQKKIGYSESVRNALTKFTAETSRRYYRNSTCNFVYSPLSLYLGLGLCSELADESAISDVYEQLGVKNRAELEEAVQSIMSAISIDTESNIPDNDSNQPPSSAGEFLNRNICSVANSIWMDDGFSLSEKGQKRVQQASEKMYADLYKEDLQSDEAYADMNDWVAKRTRNLISEIPERPGENVPMVLFNTLYFNKRWSNKMYYDGSYESVFFAENGENIKCDMVKYMQENRDGCYYDSKNATSAVLYYEDGSYIIFIDPKKEAGLDKAINEDLEEIINAFANNKFERADTLLVSFPKLDYETKLLGMQEELKAMGISSIFEGTGFAGLTGSGENDITVDRIAQKCRIKMTEKGTMAAAATEIELWEGMHGYIKSLYLNHPYAYVIMSGNGTPLFVGAVKEVNGIAVTADNLTDDE